MNKKEKMKYDKMLGDKMVYEMTPEEKSQPITKEMGELCRHRLEKRWYRRLIELNILLIVVVVAMFATNFEKNKDAAVKYYNETMDEIKAEWNVAMEEAKKTPEEKEKEKKEKAEKNDNKDSKDSEDKSDDSKSEKKDKFKSDDLPFEVTAVLYGLAMLIVGYIGLYVMYAKYRAMSLRITENNFPEVYRTIEEYANRLGIAVPKAYVIQTSGVLNAFSTFLFRRQWICIHSELFEVAYREHHDMDALNFVIAHEMAHIYYGHATLHYNLPIWFSMRVPVIGAIASRAREYSCDRLAQRLTGVEGVESMFLLIMDRHLYKMVDKEDYINEARNVKGFFVWAYNMCADHPIMSKRILALVDGRGSGELY